MAEWQGWRDDAWVGTGVGRWEGTPRWTEGGVGDDEDGLGWEWMGEGGLSGRPTLDTDEVDETTRASSLFPGPAQWPPN